MKILLRSTFVADPKDSSPAQMEELLRNYSQLYASGLGFETPEDLPLWEEIKNFVRTFNHVPDISSLRSHFKLRGEDTVLQRLDDLSALQVLVKGDFTTRLKTKAEERQTRQVAELLKEASEIAVSGREFRNGREVKTLKGPIDAVRHVLDRSHAIVAPVLGTKISGEVLGDGEDFKTEYLRVAADPLAGIGQHTGIGQMDTALNGAKTYELWIHAAFTGGMKSTTELNWAYNQAVWFGFGSVIFSLEMPYQQVRRLLYALHSSHAKFLPIRMKLGLQKTPGAEAVGLPYEHIRDGTLSKWHPNAEQFLLNYVIPDFNGKHIPELDDYWEPGTFRDSSLYGKIHIEVADPEKSDFTMLDLRQRAELIYNKTPFHALFIDHVGLMSPRKWVSSTTDRLNEIIRDAKRLAMSFNRGKGIATVALFQINREGYKQALKAKEKTGIARYDLTHLSYANEAERSADIVTTSWLDDDLSKQNRVLYQNLKSRDQKPFEPFVARVEWPNRRIVTTYDVSLTNAQNESLASSLDIGKALDG